LQIDQTMQLVMKKGRVKLDLLEIYMF